MKGVSQKKFRALPAAIGLCLAWQAAPALAADTPPPGSLTVTVARAKRACFTDTFRVTGLIVPREEVLVRPENEGMQIVQITVDDGATVTKGQTLARLAAPDMQPTALGANRPTGNVTAPAEGVVVVPRSTIVGIMASERGEPLFRIITRGEMELLADVPARRLTAMAPGQLARVEVVGVGEVPGRVRLVLPQTDPMTQLGQAYILLARDPRLRIGGFARAAIDAGTSCGPTVPISAVLYGSDGAVVQVVRDDRVETRRVRVGLLSGESAEIREGLNENDLVIARAGAFLREGDPVKPIPVEQSPIAAK